MTLQEGSTMANSTQQESHLLRTYIDGKEDGPTVVFVHGFPDDHTLWDKQVAYFKEHFRCVTVDLPGFGADDKGVERWGYSGDEVAHRLERTIEATANGRPVILVAHDWGCVFSYAVEKRRPDLVKKMVAMDIGGHLRPGVLGCLAIASYQLWLIVAFLLGGDIGKRMTEFMVKLFNIPPPGVRDVEPTMCYPYLNMSTKVIKFFGSVQFLPKCPFLYMYGCTGTKKFMMFHSSTWMDAVRTKQGSSVVKLEESGHWMMLDSAKRVNAELDTFFAK